MRRGDREELKQLEQGLGHDLIRLSQHRRLRELVAQHMGVTIQEVAPKAMELLRSMAVFLNEYQEDFTGGVKLTNGGEAPTLLFRSAWRTLPEPPSGDEIFAMVQAHGQQKGWNEEQIEQFFSYALKYHEIYCEDPGGFIYHRVCRGVVTEKQRSEGVWEVCCINHGPLPALDRPAFVL